MQYDRMVIGYHGCDEKTAERVLHGEPFKPSLNDFDWLGGGIYFWEFGADRAYRFAQEQKRRGKIKKPAIVGALIQLGRCFDLFDTRFTEDLAKVYPFWEEGAFKKGQALPINEGPLPDHKLRRRDCAVLNWYFDRLADAGKPYDTVRGGFSEGGHVYEGSAFHKETHIQISVRDKACILGVFRPIVKES